MKKTTIVLSTLLILILVWFFTREIQADLPYKLSGAEVLKVKNECEVLARGKINEWREFAPFVEYSRSGFSELGGYCYLEYYKNFDDQKYIELYNATDDRMIIVRRWPEDIGSYDTGFNWFVNGKRKYYQNTF